MFKTSCFFMILSILFCLSFNEAWADDKEKSIESLKLANWQVNTESPTSQQLMDLFQIKWKDHENGSRSNITVDDSAVNYNVIGNYDVFFSFNDGEELKTTMKVQKDSPVTLKIPPILQLEVGEEIVISNELLESYLASENETGFKYDIIKHTINKNKVGKYKIEMFVTDPYGRSSKQTIMTEVVDLEAPVIQLENKELNYVINQSIEIQQLAQDAGLSASDNYSENLHYEWYLDKLDSSVSGQYRVGVRAIDESNNASKVLYLTVNINEVEELKRFLQYEVNSSVNEQEVINDLSSKSINKVQLSSVDFNKVGIYEMLVYLKNEGQTTIEVSVVDTTAPIIYTATTFMEYDNVSQMTEDQLRKDFQLKVEDNYDADITVTFSKPIEDLSRSGQHQLVIYASDHSGNKSELPITLKIGQEVQVMSGEKKKAPSKKELNHQVTSSDIKTNGFKIKTIYSANESEEVTSEALQSIKKLASSIKMDKKKINKEKQILIPIAVVILLLIALLAIKSRKTFEKPRKAMNKR